ncbi:DUF748 domain-containing protein [Pelomonas sp. V22]|uniref:DUF748 domain-containing protein n=1 Tax=Pelomonas sp. V22 TaxID=2822139 RepID=UPI0024A7D64C|nr:DUF748 domain-containing protein [Pelomonas sp. V22]MDI4631498.1 DUF748 domain-containing protein [Pelomonas sp. V22]
MRLPIRRRWLLLLPVLLIVLPLLMAWLLLPRWIEGRGMGLASEALGRPVSVAAAHFQPWRLGLVLEQLRIGPAPAGSEDLLQVQRIDARLSWRSLIHLSPILGSLTVEQPLVRLSRLDEDHTSVDDLIQRFAAKPNEPNPAAGKEPDFALYNIRLLRGQVLLDDKTAGRQHKLEQLDLELPFISSLDTDEQVQVLPRLQGKLNGVNFGSQASLRPFDPRHDGSLDFHLAETDLQPYAVYLPRELPLQLQRGKLALDLKLSFSRPEKQAPQLTLSGTLAAKDWALSQSGKDWLTWQQLQVKIAELLPLQRRLRLAGIELDGLGLQLRRDAQGRLQLPVHAEPAKAAPAQAIAPAQPWQLALDQLALRKASLAWTDAAPAAQLLLQDIELKAQGLQWPLGKQAASFELASRLKDARLALKGQLSAEALKADADLQDFALESLAAYLKPVSPLALRGRLSSHAALQWDKPMEAASAPVVKLGELLLDKLQAGPDLSLARLSLDQAEIQPAKHQVQLGQLRLQQPRLAIKRGGEGGWNFERWMPPSAEAKPGDPPTPWQLQLAGFTLEQGQVELQDASTQRPVHLVASEIAAKLQDLAWGKPASSAMQLSLKLGAVRDGRAKVDENGKLRWTGRLSLPEPQLAGRLVVEHLPLGGISPYLEQQLGLRLQRADASWQGDVELAGPRLKLAGDLQLADLLLRMARGENREELLSWRGLNLSGLKFAVAPDEATRVAVAETRLDEFFARLDIAPDGQFNLRGLNQPANANAGATPPAQAAAKPLQYQLGPVRLSNGRIDFSDRFIRPNYNARLSELSGSVGALASDKAEMAAVELHGKVAGTGKLEIGGRFKPSPLALDIKAQASEIELAPLSPYAGKYAGYAIERGKLSTKLEYQIAPGGKLQANNQVILNQLQFGDKVDSPDATSLPVKFALALLKDRDGVIDINLPISGSIDDPEFSVGGLVWRLFLNLVGKALTSPFSLLAGGGHEDASSLAMLPGNSELGSEGMAKLDKLAKALIDRPQLRLNITGSASLEAERNALLTLRLEQALNAERQREQRRDAKAQPSRDQVLRTLYQRTDLKTRPRNLVGLLKDLPAAEMEKLLLDSYVVDAETARRLALARAVLVRDALIARGVPNERLFLAAPKGGDPQVELALEAP